MDDIVVVLAVRVEYAVGLSVGRGRVALSFAQKAYCFVFPFSTGAACVELPPVISTRS